LYGTRKKQGFYLEIGALFTPVKTTAGVIPVTGGTQRPTVSEDTLPKTSAPLVAVFGKAPVPTINKSPPLRPRLAGDAILKVMIPVVGITTAHVPLAMKLAL
jgi:hypothetical protein